MHFAIQLADSINKMADHIAYLERENEHLNKMLAIYRKGDEDRAEHHKETMGIIFTAILDPESAFNKKERIVAKAALKGITA